MQDINICTIVGRLTKDVEVRKTQTGKSVAQFTLAVNKRGEDAGADFINCVAWEKAADTIGQYSHKGDRIGIVGRIATRNYDDHSTGKKVYVTEIMVTQFQFLGARKNEPVAGNDQKQGIDSQNVTTENVDTYISEDDLPF